jgi:hypothetical protein
MRVLPSFKRNESPGLRYPRTYGVPESPGNSGVSSPHRHEGLDHISPASWHGTALAGAELFETAIDVARPNRRGRWRVFTLGRLAPRCSGLAFHPRKNRRFHRPRSGFGMLFHDNLTLQNNLNAPTYTQASRNTSKVHAPFRRERQRLSAHPSTRYSKSKNILSLMPRKFIFTTILTFGRAGVMVGQVVFSLAALSAMLLEERVILDMNNARVQQFTIQKCACSIPVETPQAWVGTRSRSETIALRAM